MALDQTGLVLTCESEESAQLFDATVGGYLTFSPDTGRHIKALLTAEPTMPMANVLMGYFYMLMGVRPLVPRAQKSLVAARENQATVTARERGHMDALDAWSRDDLRGATAHWEAVLLDHPRDVLAAKLAHFGHFYLGAPLQIRDSIARVLPAWSEADPAYGFILSMYAFGLEETGDYAQAERCGRQAVQLNPTDSWGIHAVAHVLEMQDRHAEGIQWLDTLESSWSQANNFRYHLAWHRSLYHLDQGDTDQVLGLYDDTVWDPDAKEYLDLCNDVALLARLDMAGVDTGDRWQALAEVLSKHAQQHMMNFIDAHYVLGLAAGGAADAAAHMLTTLSGELDGEWDASDTYLGVASSVGLPLCRAMVAYAEGEYDHAVQLLLPIRYDIQAIGGSHAQRDLFAQILIDAALKSGQTPLARSLLAERVALKPGNAPARALYQTALQQPD